MFHDLINNWVEGHRRDILDFCKSFVSIPSENRYPTGDEAKIQGFVAKELKEMGCEVDVFLPTEVQGLLDHPAYLEGRFYENRPNVVGTQKAGGNGRSIIFSGHVDTVPRGIDTWSVDPFSGIVQNGKQFGLGIFDMKSGMAAAIMGLKAIETLGIELNGDVIIESVVDEEYGGANGTLACRLRGYEADVAIIPEPTNMVICPASQGGSMYRFSFQSSGVGRSFSEEELLNPSYAAARFLEIFHQYEKCHAQKTSTHPLYKDGPGLTALVQGIKAGDVQLPLADRVPSTCTVDTWIQCYPETSEEELRDDLLSYLHSKAADDDILNKIPPQMEKLIRFVAGSCMPENHDLIKVTTEVGKSLGHDLPVKGAPFCCDSFMFNLHSQTPAMIWGPKGGNAHSTDEFIFVEDYFELVKMYALTLINWCGVKN